MHGRAHELSYLAEGMGAVPNQDQKDQQGVQLLADGGLGLTEGQQRLTAVAQHLRLTRQVEPERQHGADCRLVGVGEEAVLGEVLIDVALGHVDAGDDRVVVDADVLCMQLGHGLAALTQIPGPHRVEVWCGDVANVLQLGHGAAADLAARSEAQRLEREPPVVGDAQGALARLARCQPLLHGRSTDVLVALQVARDELAGLCRPRAKQAVHSAVDHVVQQRRLEALQRAQTDVRLALALERQEVREPLVVRNVRQFVVVLQQASTMRCVTCNRQKQTRRRRRTVKSDLCSPYVSGSRRNRSNCSTFRR